MKHHPLRLRGSVASVVDPELRSEAVWATLRLEVGEAGGPGLRLVQPEPRRSVGLGGAQAPF